MDTENTETNEGEVQADSTSELSGISADLLRSIGIQPETTHGTSEGKAHDGDPEPLASAEEEETVEEVADPLDPFTVKEEITEEGQAEEPQTLVEITHNGNAVKLSMEDLKSYAQKGFDYTTKTMTLGEERKQIEAEKEKFQEELLSRTQQADEREREISDVIQLKDKWDFYINSLEQTDPDLFTEIKEGFSKTAQQFSNPVLTAQMKELSDLKTSYQQDIQQREHDQIRREFTNGVEKAKTGEWGQLLDQLGLKFDEEKIKQSWVNSEGSVEDAVKSLYAADVVKLLQSKGKVTTAKKKAASAKKIPTAGTAKRAMSPVTDDGIKANARTPWNTVLSQTLNKYVKG
jgi:hypothetical protein